MKFYIPPQLSRLSVVFAIFISLVLLLRHFLIPPSFGQYGHYRGDSLKDNASLEIRYTGHKACFECHQDIEDLKQQDVHAKINCEICHGPGARHVSSAEATDIVRPSGREFCGRCHGRNAARAAGAITQVNLSEHNIGQNCTECHNPHQPWAMLK
jgi:hypothetical protein